MGGHASEMLHVAVGSTNPVKLDAVRAAFTELAIGAFDIHPVAVADGEEQPWGEAATRDGALRRARAALAEPGSDWGIGLEAGLIRDDLGVLLTSWIAVCRPGNEPTLVRTAGFYLPAAIAEHVLAGAELNDAWRQAAGMEGVGRGAGTVGTLTDGCLDRVRLYRDAVLLAVARARASAEEVID